MNVNAIATGIIYLAGVNATTDNYYQINTDSLGHLSFATGTNMFNIGTGSTANGNITCNETTQLFIFYILLVFALMLLLLHLQTLYPLKLV